MTNGGMTNGDCGLRNRGGSAADLFYEFLPHWGLAEEAAEQRDLAGVDHFVARAPEEGLALGLRDAVGLRGEHGCVEVGVVVRAELGEDVLVHAIEGGADLGGRGVTVGVGIGNRVAAEAREELRRHPLGVGQLGLTQKNRRQPELRGGQVADLPGDVRHWRRGHAEPVGRVDRVEQFDGVSAGGDDLVDGDSEGHGSGVR